METKVCNVCNIEKKLSDFYFMKNRNKHMNYCSDCCCEKTRKHRQTKEYKEYHKEYQKTEKYKDQCRKYRSTDQAKQNHREKEKERRKKTKLEIIKHYSKGEMCCELCKFNDDRALSVDHINGGGNKHRKSLSFTAGHQFYTWLIKNNYPEGYRILCMNCQFIRKSEQNVN
jgi:hypothetical protein